MDGKAILRKGSDYTVRILNGMAQGLFSSLIIGLIIKQIGIYSRLGFLENLGQIAQYMTCPAIGVGVAYALNANPLAMFSSAIVGALGGGTITLTEGALFSSISVGEPLGACIASLIGVLIGKLICGKTNVDIILVPLSVLIAGSIAAFLLSPVISQFMVFLGSLINKATQLYPFFMGIIVSTMVGMILTLPISSAAICISLGLSGLAAGAACAGCSAQMIGFAFCSFRENGFGGLISQGIGTSMLQIPNIWRNWKIWIPPTVSSAIVGPISTCVFKLENIPSGAGMGTSGLVGQFGAVSVMGLGCIWKLLIVHFLLPALISTLLCILMKKAKWIGENDLKLPS